MLLAAAEHCLGSLLGCHNHKAVMSSGESGSSEAIKQLCWWMCRMRWPTHCSRAPQAGPCAAASIAPASAPPLQRPWRSLWACRSPSWCSCCGYESSRSRFPCLGSQTASLLCVLFLRGVAQQKVTGSFLWEEVDSRRLTLTVLPFRCCWTATRPGT